MEVCRKRVSEPVRMCIGCRARRSKWELLRFVERDGRLFFDPLYRAPGRGVSICPSLKCFERGLKRKVLEKALRCTLRELPNPDALRREVLRTLEELVADSLRMGLKFKGVVLGRDAVRSSRGRLSLLVLAEDLSENSIRELEDLEVERVFFGSKEFWGEVFSRRPLGVIGILDKGIADKVKGFVQKYRELRGD